MRKRNNVTIRMRDALKAALEEQAVRQQRSLSEEIETRLERSMQEDSAFGGSEMRQIAYLMVTAFNAAGRLRAGGNPQWVEDPSCYRAGMRGVLEALLLGLPDDDPDAMVLEFEALKGRILTRLRERRSGCPAQNRPAKRRSAA